MACRPGDVFDGDDQFHEGVAVGVPFYREMVDTNSSLHVTISRAQSSMARRRAANPYLDQICAAVRTFVGVPHGTWR